jgi:hypothetical protein
VNNHSGSLQGEAVLMCFSVLSQICLKDVRITTKNIGNFSPGHILHMGSSEYESRCFNHYITIEGAFK